MLRLPHRGWRLACLGAFGLLASLASPAPTEAEIRTTYRGLIDQVNASGIKQTYQTVSSFGSRLTGSEGERQTFSYAAERLSALGATQINKREFVFAFLSLTSASLSSLESKCNASSISGQN